MSEEKTVRSRSTPANYPVAYLYYANGMHHHAGSCCDASALHYSEIISPEQLTLQDCSENPSSSDGTEIRLPASFPFDTRFQDAPLESNYSIIPTTLILHRSEVSSPEAADGNGVQRTPIGGNYRFVSSNAALDDLINAIEDLRFTLFAIQYRMFKKACVERNDYRYCFLKRIAQSYYSFSSNNSPDNGREVTILDATYSLEFRIARVKIQQLPEIGYEQYFELTWG